MVNDQASALRNLVKNRETKNQAHTIAIFSGKGGVGKSNFVVNFGLALSKHHKKVMMIDLDIGMGNIDILLGKHPTYSIADMLEKKLRIFDMIETVNENFSYIAAGTSLTHFFKMDDEAKAHFVEQFQALVDSYDFILFDLGAGMTSNHLTFIEAADQCIVLTTPEPTSLTDSYAAMKHLILDSDRKNVHMSLLVNRTTRLQEGLDVYERLREVIANFLNYQLDFLGQLPDDPIVTKAVKQQQPFLTLYPKASISKSLQDLVLRFLKEERPSQTQPTKRFMQRIKSIFSKHSS